MLNIIELEKQWMRYKIKYYFPHFTIFVSTLIISIVVFVLIKHDATSSTTPVKKVVTPLPKELPPTIKKQELPSETQLKLQPSLKFIKDMQNISRPYVEAPKVHHPKVVETKEKVKPQTVEVVLPKQEKMSRISIKRKDTSQDLQKIIKRFKQSNNPIRWRSWRT